MNQRDTSLICLIKNDLTNLILLHRKISSSDIDTVWIEVPYEGDNKVSVTLLTYLKHFPRFKSLGPIPLYAEFISEANMPAHIDLNHYIGTAINVDIMDHIKKGLHLNQIFPVQKTNYRPNIHIEVEPFNSGINLVRNNTLNFCINIFDETYAMGNSTLIDEVRFLISTVAEKTKKPITLFPVGMIESLLFKKAIAFIKHEFKEEKNVTVIDDIALSNFSCQVGVILNADFLITGPYNLGILAYSMNVNTLSIIPFTMAFVKGKTIDPSKKNSRYLEVEDIDVSNETTDMICTILSKDGKI